MTLDLSRILTEPNLLDVYIEAERESGYLAPPVMAETATEFRNRIFRTLQAFSGRSENYAAGVDPDFIPIIDQIDALTWRVMTAARLIGMNVTCEEDESIQERDRRLREAINAHPRAIELGIIV